MPEKDWKKKSKYESLYRPALKYLTVNGGDNEIRAVTIRLPDPPALNLIDGYGLPPEQQKFCKSITPPRLKMLEDTCLEKAKVKYEGRLVAYMQQEFFWQELNDNMDNYKEEIAYIKKQWWYIINGYWCFIFGKPYWIPPKHYFYLTFYYPTAVKGNRIEYRDEDRQVKTWEHYCDTTTETFKNVDDKGNAIPNEDGTYEMIDVGHRTCVGDAHPKRRRKGVTMQNSSDAIHVLITGKERHCIVQADTGKSAEDIYQDHVLPAWKALDVWLRPVFDGNSDPADGIHLKPPSAVTGGRCLNGYLIWNDSAKEGANDRRKIHYLLNDEVGKVSLYDVNKRWRIDKYTMIQGTDIHGTSRHPSTIEEMNLGGEFFQKVFFDSNFYQRDLVGMTTSGLFRLFRPVYEGWDDFIDEWGFSVVDNPTAEQLKNPPYGSQFSVLGMGSKEFWQRRYDALLQDPTKHADYRIEVRKHPMVSGDCWRSGSSDMGWDYLILDQALANLRGRSETIRGNFIRNGDIADWVPCDNGRFVVSNLFLGQQNQWTWSSDGAWNEKKQAYVPSKSPKYPSRFSMGVDPYDFRSAPQGKKSEFHLSKGGIGVIHNDDPNESHLPIQDRESGQLICYYEHRLPSQTEFFDDIIACAVWYGALINLETNLKRFIEYATDEGYGSYLWRATMPDGTYRKDPGTYNTSATKSDMLNGIRDFIAYRAHKCKIKEFLVQARDMRTPAELTKRDGLAGVGWGLYAAKSTYGIAVERIDGEDSIDLVSWYGDQYQTSY